MTLRRLVLFSLALAPFAIGAFQEQKQLVVYEGEVEAILRAHCGSCHGADADRSAGLDLTSLKGILEGSSRGKVVVPGKAEESVLLERLEGRGTRPQMPLGFRPLPAEKIAKVKAWIDGGCESSGKAAVHWAYVPPKKPGLPAVHDTNWCRNEIDRFVLARLESRGLRPAPEADKRTLARRLHLDLTGLPPSPAQVRAFLQDARPDAYGRLVDRLLASPRYGERMARPWLDLARYADSDGYEKDLNRTAWKYRDWVIDAFNVNLPYDVFTRDQLAGDLLPKPTLDQLVATGFNRNSMFNSEGGVDPAEAQFNVVLDRVNTVSTVWLGSTLQCARCHDHKYDPFTQKDYYSLSAVFANTEVSKDGDYKIGEEKWHEPNIAVPTPVQRKQQKGLEERVKSLSSALAKPNRAAEEAFTKWLATGGHEAKWERPTNIAASSRAGQEFVVRGDASLFVKGEAPDNDAYTVKWTSTGPVAGIRVEAVPDQTFAYGGPGRSSSGNFILTKASAWANGRPQTIARVLTSHTQAGYDAARTLVGDIKSGWAIYPDAGKTSEILFQLERPLAAGAQIEIVLEFGSDDWPKHEIGRFRVSTTSDPKAELLSNQARALLDDPKKTTANREALLLEFKRIYPPTRQTFQKLSDAKVQLAALSAQIPTAQVIREIPGVADLKGRIHVRGEYLQPGAEVLAAPPTSLGGHPATRFSRLELTKWLTSPENPLAARVEVNRLWEILFGKGLVETSEDFGTQGARPSHPELLDWLAVSFRESGWDIKATLKKMVMSATYRQTSASTREKQDADPENLLLSHAPRYRMEAEMVRDNQLTIAGLLSPKIGGPSVFPDQPEGVWNTPYNGEQWTTSQGEDRYRRGIYTFAKRSSPYPSFSVLDATSRETCTVRRLRTNTPLQALALLNDKVAMEAAAGLADQMVKHAKGRGDQLAYGFEACTSRAPSPQEMKRLMELFSKLESQGAKAPLVLVANTLLNLDETLNRN